MTSVVPLLVKTPVGLFKKSPTIVKVPLFSKTPSLNNLKLFKIKPSFLRAEPGKLVISKLLKILAVEEIRKIPALVIAPPLLFSIVPVSVISLLFLMILTFFNKPVIINLSKLVILAPLLLSIVPSFWKKLELFISPLVMIVEPNATLISPSLLIIEPKKEFTKPPAKLLNMPPPCTCSRLLF